MGISNFEIKLGQFLWSSDLAGDIKFVLSDVV